MQPAQQLQIEKNIKTIQAKLSTFTIGSKNYIKYTNRLKKKLDKLKHYKTTRTRDESLSYKQAFANGELDLSNLNINR